MAANLTQIQQMLAVLQQSLVDLTQDVQSVKGTTTASANVLAALQATANNAWKRLDDVEAEISEVQGQVRRAGTRDDGPKWNLEHKGALKEYSGEKKSYHPWAKKVMAFCNTKVHGFRKALLWAERMRSPITDRDLQATGWEHIQAANSKLYDLLSLMTTLDALAKVETTPGGA